MEYYYDADRLAYEQEAWAQEQAAQEEYEYYHRFDDREQGYVEEEPSLNEIRLEKLKGL